MANTAMDLTKIVKLNTAYELKKTSATSEVASASETFEFDIPDNYKIIERIVVIVEETGNKGDITAQVVKGDSWTAKNQTVTCTQNKATAFSFEPGPAVNFEDGVIQIKLTPASGIALAGSGSSLAKISAVLIKGNKR